MTENEDKVFQAIKNGDVATVRQELAAGLDVNHVFEGVDVKPSLLHVAVGNCQLSMLKLLVESGADLSKEDKYDYTPLDDAVFKKFPAGAYYLNEKKAPLNKKSVGELERVLANCYEIVYNRPLAHRHLCEVFNFKTREYFALVLKEENGAVECMNQMSFAEVKNRARLREAFEEYKARGGPADESILTLSYDDRPKRPLLRNGG